MVVGGVMYDALVAPGMSTPFFPPLILQGRRAARYDGKLGRFTHFDRDIGSLSRDHGRCRDGQSGTVTRHAAAVVADHDGEKSAQDLRRHRGYSSSHSWAAQQLTGISAFAG